jgi:catechol 2,3-dioxygenase-like lactoylglutathione lyase family enzyme
VTDDRPVFDQINLVVRDMAAMVEFYRRLGVEIDDTEAPWDRHHRTLVAPDGIDFDLDSVTFAGQWNKGWPAGRTGAVLGFKVATRDAVDATYIDLTNAGYLGQQAPYDAFWGARYAIVADPDGNSVGIMSPADPDRRAPSPSPPVSRGD